MKFNIKFDEAVREYKKNLLSHKIFTKDSLRLETHVESLRDWSELISLKD